MPQAKHPHVAAEVMELGQALFDALIEAAGRPPDGDVGEFPAAEMRAAANEFFCALRLLLGLERDPDGPPRRPDRSG